MSEQPNTAEAAATETEATETQNDQQKPTETVDFWKQKAREQEKRAKENADAAKRLADIEAAQMSEAEKTARRIKELEDQLVSRERDALRFKVASKFGVSDEDADLFLTGSDEETLTRQAERLAAHQAEAGKPRAPKPDPNQGRIGQGPKSTADQFADFFSNQLP